jgi:hypothetical protein
MLMAVGAIAPAMTVPRETVPPDVRHASTEVIPSTPSGMMTLNRTSANVEVDSLTKMNCHDLRNRSRIAGMLADLPIVGKLRHPAYFASG